MERVDLIVVGAGIIGLMTASEFKRRCPEKKVICLEADVPAGYASYGENRIFRHRHADPEYILRAKESGQLWNNWEKFFDKSFLKRSGHLFSSSDLKKERSMLYDAGIKTFELTSDQVNDFYPLFRPEHEEYLFDPLGGIIDSRGITTQLTEYLDDSIRIERVEKISSFDIGKLTVVTDKSEYLGERIILAAGPGNESLAKEVGITLSEFELNYHLRPVFSYKKELVADYPALSEYRDAGNYYLVPVQKGLAVGLGYPFGSVNRESEANIIESRLEELVQNNLPGLEPGIVSGLDICPSVSLVKEGRRGSDDFVIERNESSRVQAVLGGNLFKFAPWISKSLIDNLD